METCSVAFRDPSDEAVSEMVRLEVEGRNRRVAFCLGLGLMFVRVRVRGQFAQIFYAVRRPSFAADRWWLHDRCGLCRRILPGRPGLGLPRLLAALLLEELRNGL